MWLVNTILIKLIWCKVYRTNWNASMNECNQPHFKCFWNMYTQNWRHDWFSGAYIIFVKHELQKIISLGHVWPRDTEDVNMIWKSCNCLAPTRLQIELDMGCRAFNNSSDRSDMQQTWQLTQAYSLPKKNSTQENIKLPRNGVKRLKST